MLYGVFRACERGLSRHDAGGPSIPPHQSKVRLSDTGRATRHLRKSQLHARTMSKRRVTEEFVITDSSNAIQIIPLGAGNEVGRSCIVLKYQ